MPGRTIERAGEHERSASIGERATRLASLFTSALGSFPAMIAALLLIVLWATTGPLFGFSDTWQLVINTGTTVVTFIMVFVIQNTQNRESRAVQTKLDAIVEALDKAQDRLVGIEDRPDRDIRREQDMVRAAASVNLSPPAN